MKGEISILMHYIIFPILAFIKGLMIVRY